jgi:SOS response associated peptidase (SRAP)
VRAIHLSIHLERNPRALSADDAAREPAASLQHLPDHADKHGRSSRRQERNGPDAVGADSVLVEEEGERDAGELTAPLHARADTVADKPMFRSAFQRTRCLIPASSYYEWQDTPTGREAAVLLHSSAAQAWPTTKKTAPAVKPGLKGVDQESRP